MIDLEAVLRLRSEGRSLREIGQITGHPRSSISIRLAKARARGATIPASSASLDRGGSPICPECGFRHFVSKAHRGPMRPRECPSCGEPFRSVRPRRFHSDACAERYHRQADRDRRAASRKTTSPAQLIYRRRIFERDGWRCGICAEPVDPSLPATDDFGATLDHIIPLARGGQHVESNVQLAHWSCNRAKGAGARAA